MDAYDHVNIEKKWQEKWADSGIDHADDSFEKEKRYVLDMFPYPSGAGLHTGHVEGYTATDVSSRFKRMQGFNVLHPMGFDSFGLPAENYAIKTGVHPSITTEEAISNFTRQMKSLGFSYDWSREIAAHRPDYYKWTQWFFLVMFKNGLAEKRIGKVNWCPKDQTVLANEQVVDGKCERCGATVIQKDLEQWFFKITKYADQLIGGLDSIDWPESTKSAQRNWIGKSEGAEIDFQILVNSEQQKEKITVFTTRPDTLFGATYLVLAPENPLVAVLAGRVANKDEVAAYIIATAQRTDLERSENKEKTGVELKGVKAINPANQEEIPVWIADHVIGSYGAGAIMAVPAHDERDFEFAKKMSLRIRPVVIPSCIDYTNPHREGKIISERDAVIAILHDPKTDRYLCLRWKEQPWTTFITGGVEDGEEPIEAGKREIAEETGYRDIELERDLGRTRSEFFAAHKDVNRIANNAVLLYSLKSDHKDGVDAEEAAQHEAVWMSREEIVKTGLQHAEFSIIWDRLQNKKEIYTGRGVLFDSGAFDGMTTEEAKQRITTSVGGRMKVTFKLRDWLVSRQRYWGAPIPIVYDREGKPHVIPLEHLPWLLPTDVEFKPTGVSPLSQSKELQERVEKIFGQGFRPEVDTMDTFVCSSWYYFRFADPKNQEMFASKEQIQKWLPVDLYVGGAEHTVLHLLYARFFTKVLKDLGYISFDEPFLKLRHQGMILAEDGRKMSKSLGNVVNPDDVIATHGADALRLYEMFMGPLEMMKPWNTKNIIGCSRFLERVWKLQGNLAVESNSGMESSLSKTIKKVGEDYELMKFNTAIAALMIALNDAERFGMTKEQYAAFVQIIAPLAPHICEELWQRMGNQESVHLSSWPQYDETKLIDLNVTVTVQVDGKTRATVMVARGTDEASVRPLAEAAAGKWLEEASVQKVIFVADRLISFVLTK
jgi:leucyl-tRNA synthetase